MRATLSLMLAAALLGSAGMAQAADRSPAAQIARATAGRTAGTPVDCINLRDIRSSRIVDRTAIIYETIGGQVYINTPDSGANSLRSDLVLVTDTHSPQLCNVDIVRLFDNTSRMQMGSVGLGKFVPYARPARH